MLKELEEPKELEESKELEEPKELEELKEQQESLRLWTTLGGTLLEVPPIK